MISLLYITAPALAVLAKYDVYTLLVGSSFSELPSWVSAWGSVDKTLMSVTDINSDGIVQLAEVTIGGDLIVRATPEIAGLPYVVTALAASAFFPAHALGIFWRRANKTWAIVGMVSGLLTAAPDRGVQELVAHVRYPNLEGRTGSDAA